MPVSYTHLDVYKRQESDLQKSVFKLHQICKQYNMKISTIKTNVMAFRGKQPIKTEIMIIDQIVEQVSQFNYLEMCIRDRTYTLYSLTLSDSYNVLMIQ